jgi:enediyne biosynthesis protein E4
VSNSYNQFLPGVPPAQLHLGIGGGQFRAEPAFEAHGAAGYGETIVVADFDNDSDTDVYIPYYSYESADEHSYLFMNDGTGTFADVADARGVALRNISAGLRPEGAQAIDFDFDGDLDLAVASKLFVNQLTETGTFGFVEKPFPVEFDEGLQFIDWDNNGVFDVIKQYPYSDVGPQLFEYDGTAFRLRADAFPFSRYMFAYGLNSYDVNGDGRVDVIASGGRSQSDGAPRYPLLFINTPAGFKKNDYSPVEVLDGNDISAFADFDHSGTVDFVTRFATGRVFMNGARSTNVIRIRLLGSRGEENQYGRVVRIRSEFDSSVVMARAVDGGSGYLSNNQYEMLVNLPLTGPYTIEAVFRTGVIRVPNVSARNSVDIYEDGRVRIRTGASRQ